MSLYKDGLELFYTVYIFHCQFYGTTARVFIIVSEFLVRYTI